MNKYFIVGFEKTAKIRPAYKALAISGGALAGTGAFGHSMGKKKGRREGFRKGVAVGHFLGYRKRTGKTTVKVAELKDNFIPKKRKSPIDREKSDYMLYGASYPLGEDNKLGKSTENSGPDRARPEGF